MKEFKSIVDLRLIGKPPRIYTVFCLIVAGLGSLVMFFSIFYPIEINILCKNYKKKKLFIISCSIVYEVCQRFELNTQDHSKFRFVFQIFYIQH